MWDRRQEHITALEGENKESPLFEHMEESHRGMDPEFKLKIVGFYKKPLQRQTMEGLLIGKPPIKDKMRREREVAYLYQTLACLKMEELRPQCLGKKLVLSRIIDPFFSFSLQLF